MTENINEELKQLESEDTLSLNPKKFNDNGLSNDQTKALESLLEWALRVKNNRDESIFYTLAGYAGTGKTTLVSYFLKAITSQGYRSSRICVCAPTHKAKKVIADKTGWDIQETLQALLGLKLDVNLEDFDVNSPTFNSIGERKIRDYDLVIVDESSMVNTDLYTTIVDCAKGSGTKVLFVGDAKQLNPVKEYTISPALIAPINRYELTEIVRQDVGNPLIHLLTLLREDIANNTDNALELLRAKPEDFNDKDEGYKTVSGNDFGVCISEVLNSEAFQIDRNHCRFIAWTNDCITTTNSWIRKNVFKHTDKLVVGELLLSYKTVAIDKEIVIVNSDDYLVESITPSVIREYNKPIDILIVAVRGVDTGTLSRVKVVVPTQENYKNFVEVHNDFVRQGKEDRRQWKWFYEFRNDFTVMETLTEGKALVTKKDMDYGYGITIHKSQGSTYNTVFVNGKDINKNPNNTERRRLWYVALSRASNKVYINF